MQTKARREPQTTRKTESGHQENSVPMALKDLFAFNYFSISNLSSNDKCLFFTINTSA